MFMLFRTSVYSIFFAHLVNSCKRLCSFLSFSLYHLFFPYSYRTMLYCTSQRTICGLFVIIFHFDILFSSWCIRLFKMNTSLFAIRRIGTFYPFHSLPSPGLTHWTTNSPTQMWLSFVFFSATLS